MIRALKLISAYYSDLFSKSIQNRNFRLRWVFYVYLIIILVFAVFYNLSYETNPSSFVFAKDVHQSKLSSQIREDSTLIHNLEKEFLLLKNINQRLTKTSGVKIDSLYSDYKFIFLLWHMNELNVELAINKRALKNDNKSELLIHNVLIFKRGASDPFFENEVHLKTASSDFDKPETIGLKIIDVRMQDNVTELKNIKSADYLRWNFIDFFYFSTITQATVGYGDMLPNSTFIRFLVALQTLIGVFITIIMVTYSYDLYRKRREKE